MKEDELDMMEFQPDDGGKLVQEGGLRGEIDQSPDGESERRDAI